MSTKKALYFDETTTETDDQAVSVYAETTTPANVANKAKIYAKDVAGVSKMHALDSDGNEIELGTGGGGAIQTLTSVSNQVAIDASLGSQFKLNDLSEDTEIQIPTNGADGNLLTISIENLGGQTVTFAAGWVIAGQLEVSSEAGRVSVISAIARDYGAGLEWTYAVSHAETVTGISDIDIIDQTVNATPYNLAVFATASDNATYLLDLSFTGSDTTDELTYQRGTRAVVYRDGVSALTLRDVLNYSTTNEDGAWDTNVSVSGQNILIQVTGDGTNPVKWRLKGVAVEVV